MIQELRKKYLGRYILLSIMFIAIGILFLSLNMESIKLLLNKTELSSAEIDTSTYVSADISYIYDYYAYTEEDGRITEKEYLVPIGETEVMGVALGKSYLDKADANMNATYDLMEGDEDAYSRINKIHVSGTLVPMEGESERYYREYVNALGWSQEEVEMFLPYLLKVGYIGENSKTEFILWVVLSAFCLIFGIVWLILGLSGRYLKHIRKYCEASGNPEIAKERLEQFYVRTPEKYGIRLSTEYFMSTKGMHAALVESREIIWVYLHILKHSVNYIPVGKSYSIMVMKADGSRLEVGMRGKKKAERAMEYIGQALPYVFIGYSDELQSIYDKNRQSMIQAVEERRNPTEEI